ncbi:hypothetical protein EG329_011891 [Mollisiaceae sp. DMI_Dod_QoI]|nr:hypothetical protein EG329_011891 [Helotiales sp. DMI_Dod_QoI]
MSAYIITRTKFEGGKPTIGQSKVVEVCSSLEIANAAAKIWTQDIWKTYENRAAVERGTSVQLTPSGSYMAVIRLHQTDIRGTSIRVSKRKLRTTMPLHEQDETDNQEAHLEDEPLVAETPNTFVPYASAHIAQNECNSSVFLVDATNCLGGHQFVQEGHQQPLNCWQVEYLIKKHGGTYIHSAQTGAGRGTLAVVGTGVSGTVLSELERRDIRWITQPQLISMIETASAIQQPSLKRPAIVQPNLPEKRQKVDLGSRSPPAPPCPEWIYHEIAKLRTQFPDDRFDCIMERQYYPNQVKDYGSLVPQIPSPFDGFAAKIVCFDCPEKAFGVGCTPSLWTFRTYHLENNLLHRQRVEDRDLSEAPMDELMEKAARLHQAMAGRLYSY